MRIYAFLFMAVIMLAPAAYAETHDVKMYTRSENGTMIYEPEFLAIAPGDSVRFLPEQPTHNAATIEGMTPESAEPFRSKINEDFTVTLSEPGIYGIKCSPHFSMGMVMLIRVGETAGPVLPESLPKRARERFEKIIRENAP